MIFEVFSFQLYPGFITLYFVTFVLIWYKSLRQWRLRL